MPDQAMVGVIRVLSSDDPDFVGRHGRLIEARYPGIRTVSRAIPDQPHGVYDDATEAEALPKILQLVQAFDREGVDAIIVSCAADPALTEARRLTRRPVIGAGSAAAAVALGLGHRIAALNLNAQTGTPRAVRQVLGDHLVAEASPEGVRESPDLLTPAGRSAALAAAVRLASEGADAVVLLCTGFATIGLADELRRRHGIRAVDPVEAAGLVAWHVTR